MEIEFLNPPCISGWEVQNENRLQACCCCISCSRKGRKRVKGRTVPSAESVRHVGEIRAAPTALTAMVLILMTLAKVVGLPMLAVTRTPSTWDSTIDERVPSGS